jgi:ubiquinone/menaquinone biosynthesis C-methylase UbiE
MDMSEKKPTNMHFIRKFFESPKNVIEPYAKKDQVIADLGCGPGVYTIALAQIVGPNGKVYAVDLDKKCIQMIEKKMYNESCHNIETHASSASDLSFIKDESVDFILANGLLCSMVDHRPEAVNEIKRILKPEGKAFLSLGMPPPFGFVNRTEWEKILEGFRVILKLYL